MTHTNFNKDRSINAQTDNPPILMQSEESIDFNAILKEESGSGSTSGAGGTFLEMVLKRLNPDIQEYGRMVDASMMISADNAHGIHPNFMGKHDENHGPILNAGPVIKINANQRYASNSQTSAAFKLLCKEVDVPFQSFVTRTDMGCGSTIGPITATRIGVKTIDIGLPTFAMHSIRESAGAKDAYMLYKVFTQYFS